MGLTCRNGHVKEDVHVTGRGNLCRTCESNRKKKYSDKTHYWDWYRFGRNKKAVMERDNNACVKCFSTSPLSVDHINRDKSNNSMDNLQTLCLSCHGAKDGVAGLGVKKGMGKYA